MLSMSSQEIDDLIALQAVALHSGQKAQKPENRKKRKITPTGDVNADIPAYCSDPTANGQAGQAAITLSKAASRMRQYRADHKNDRAWLSKEAERMRKMRAVRKGLPLPVTDAILDVIGTELNKPAKERKKAIRRKKDIEPVVGAQDSADATVETIEGTEGTETAPVPATDSSSGEVDIEGAASFLDRNIKRDEFRKKEAERIRRYRSLKRQDQVWKDKDAERMRMYRAKKKGDSGKEKGIASNDAEHYELPPHELYALVHYSPNDTPALALAPVVATESTSSTTSSFSSASMPSSSSASSSTTSSSLVLTAVSTITSIPLALNGDTPVIIVGDMEPAAVDPPAAISQVPL